MHHPHPGPPLEGEGAAGVVAFAYSLTYAFTFKSLPPPMMIALTFPAMMSLPTTVVPSAMRMPLGDDDTSAQYAGCQHCDDQFDFHVRFLASRVEVAYKVTGAALNEC